MREAELLKGIVTAWGLVSNSSTLLPGGIHEFEAESDNVPVDPSTGKKAEIYATAIAQENPIARMTNGGVVREHIVTVSVKHTEGLNACAAILEAMASTTAGIPANMPSLDNTGVVIYMWPHSSKGGQTEMQRGGKTISDAAIAWRVQTDWPY